MMDRKLPDTPWHIGYAKKKEADPRRHKARCIYKNGNTCSCNKSPVFMCKCLGSSHCLYYEENNEFGYTDIEEVVEIQIENHRALSVEEEAQNRERVFKQRKIAQRKKLEQIGEKELQKRYGKALICPICSEDLKKENGQRVCPYCGFRV